MTVVVAFVWLVVMMPAGASAASTCKGEDDGFTAQTVPDAERSLLCLTNAHRVANGLAPLAHDGSLRTAARNHSQDMDVRNFFAHETPLPGSTDPSDRAIAAGYPTGFVGENIAFSPNTPKSHFEAWRNSPGHNSNMLGLTWTNAGMGLALGSPSSGASASGTGTALGTQVFGLDATGATDTAVDLYTSDACAAANEAAKKAKKKVKKAKKKVKKAKSPSAKKRAKKQLKKKKKKLKKGTANAEKVCDTGTYE